jgi:3-oxoacyl-[acyl-carrier protein] reductase
MKTALVTGAARGIGRAIATDLARDHHVAFTWHSHPADDVQADLPDALAIQADLTAPGTPQNVIDATLARFGKIDLIVNNAGAIAASPREAFNIEDHHTILDLNLSAPAALLAAALPHLKAGAAIVNISSVNADLQPMGASIYGASKAALNTWTRGMAKELGPEGIRVNGVAPGAVNTPEDPRDPELTQAFLDLTTLDHLASPEDIAAAVRFLASDDARSITGQILRVCSGYRL